MRGWLVVFGRLPRVGAVKTRLSPPLSREDAAGLYRCLLLDVLDESAAAARALGLDAVLAADPPEAAAALAAVAPAGFRVVPQAGGELGARMRHVAWQAAAAGAPLALLRGSDSPALDRVAVREAVDALAAVDLVLRPDPDGGYHLVGLGPSALARGVTAGLFDHAMSTPTVLRDTRAGAERLQLRVRSLSPGFDIDRFEDLRRLAAARRSAQPLPCRRTLAYLDERRLWPDEPNGSGPNQLRVGS